VSDSTAFTFSQRSKIEQHLIKGIFFNGDNAYQCDMLVLPPYTESHMSLAPNGIAQLMKVFNSFHSSERICSEHGIGKVKQWGVMRGRSDVSLFKSTAKFHSVTKVCWGITNFITLH